MSERCPRKTYSTDSKIYDAFQACFYRKGIANPGTHASLYLDVFWTQEAKMCKITVVGRGLCSDKESDFTKWRDKQKICGFLDWDIVTVDGHTKCIYKPGKKTINQINKLALTDDLIVNQSDLKRLEKDLEKKLEAKFKKEIEDLKAKFKSEMEDHRRETQSYKEAFKLICRPILGDKPSDEEVSLFKSDINSGRFKLRAISAIENEEYEKCDKIDSDDSGEDDFDKKGDSAKGLFLI